MKRIILVLTITAVMLTMLVAGGGLSALAQEEAPGDPQCGWYYNTGEGFAPWWEYWCWWPGWGWEYVFWAWD